MGWRGPATTLRRGPGPDAACGSIVSGSSLSGRSPRVRRRGCAGQPVTAATGRSAPDARPCASRRPGSSLRKDAAPAGRRAATCRGDGRGRRPCRELGRTASRRGGAVPARPRPSRSTASPRAKAGSRSNARWNGSVVWIPVTSTSSRARRIRSMAAADPGPTVRSWRSTGRSRAGRARPPATAVSTRTSGPAGITQRADAARRRREVASRVLGGEPDLDGMARADRRARGRRQDRRPTAAGRPRSTAARRPGRDRSPAPSRRAQPGAARSPRGTRTAVGVEEELGGRRVRAAGGARGTDRRTRAARARSSRVRPGAGDSSTSFW